MNDPSAERCWSDRKQQAGDDRNYDY